ncbi:T9SS type A sorting domain-containing protein [Aquimarina longa]|uniref:T9SS type A sorting domain-containing protein n=1 Tax=Aquimarina longa TaxID=1080221 RepID=UPI000783EC49|nr:T9SS type A sorting domain-containing protein [Aquimarina longa]
MKRLLILLFLLSVSTSFADDLENFQVGSCVDFSPINNEEGHVTFSFDLVTRYKIDYGFPMNWFYHNHGNSFYGGNEGSSKETKFRHRYYRDFRITKNTPDHVYVDVEVSYNVRIFGVTKHRTRRKGFNVYIGHLRDRYWRVLNSNVTDHNSNVLITAGNSIQIVPGFQYTPSSGLKFTASIQSYDCKAKQTIIGSSIEQGDTELLYKEPLVPYPNPSSGIVRINSDQIISDYTIYNSKGIIVDVELKENGEMDFTNVDDGLYILSLKRGNKIENIKIVIQH